MPQVSFDKDIKPLMTDTDRDHMLFMFDLWSYKDVKDNADDIYDAVSSGRMPWFFRSTIELSSIVSAAAACDFASISESSFA